VIGQEPVAAALGFDIQGFKLFLLGGWPETVAQVYLFLAMMALVSTAAVEVVTQFFDSPGDYEDTLATVSYGMAPVPLFAIPVVFLGFDIMFVVGPLVSALVLSVPIALLIGWTTYAGVAETHELPSSQALAVVGAMYLGWAITAGIAALGLTAG